jgi:hypothetical protein
MRFMLLICRDENITLTPEQRAAIGPATEAWITEMDGRGIRIEGHQLKRVASAASVRVRDGQLLVSDGPFAETKEQVAGFDLLECASQDEAVQVAARHPVAAIGTVEVRPFEES